MFRCSIFCSFYKGQSFIEGYLNDMLRQSAFDNTEFIFLDCNSPENEKDQILPVTQQFKNVKYYKLEKDPGLYAAWNIALKLCSAPIVGNWNIDDRKNTHSIEILLKAFDRNPLLDIVYGITYVSTIANEKYEDNTYEQIYPCLPHSLSNLIRNNNPHCMPLWRKNLHDRFGLFDENYKTASDGDMWLRCAVGGAKIDMVNHPVGLYYHNPAGRSTDPKHLQQMVDEVNGMRQKYIGYLNNG